MERLSHIIRNSQGPLGASHHRLPQASSSSGQRLAAGGARPLPGQPSTRGETERNTGRLDEQTRQPGLHRPRAAQPARPSVETGETWEAPMPQPLRQLPRAHYNPGGPPRATRMPQPTHYAEAAQGDYYQEDDISTVVPADVQEDWNDDTAGMRYGDWESAPGYHYAPEYEEEEESYPHPAARPRETNPGPRQSPQELSPTAQRLVKAREKLNPLATRELYRASVDQQRAATTREMRETRLPVPAANPPLAPAQNPPHLPHRATQPLRAQPITRVSELPGRALPQQQAVLPETPRESGALHPSLFNAQTNVTTCPICKGAGFLRNNVPFGHPQFGKALACQCKEQERKRKRRQQLQELSNLGAFAGKRFHTFNARVPGLQEAYRISTEFAKAPDGWLLLIGPNGCGKTHLAAAIANDCLEAGSVVLFATVPDLLDHLRAAFAPDASEVYDQLFARMREAEVLILDDLGAQQSSPWASEKLFQLLNYRYNSGFPTVITANTKGLQSTDERIRSRLSDISLVTAINLDRARDYRPNNPHRG